MRSLTLLQAAVAIAALIGITILGVNGNVNSDALVAIYSAVIGAGLGAGGIIANGAADARRSGAADKVADAVVEKQREESSS